MNSVETLRVGNKFIWFVVSLLIVASWVGNLWYKQSMQLENPIFMKHYIELNGYKGDWFELNYIENKNADRRITGIHIEELPMLHIQVDSNPSAYRYQVFGRAQGVWNIENPEDMDKTPLSIKEVTVYYSKGPPEKVPIGEIKVIWEKNDDILETSMSSASSNGTGQNRVFVKERLLLEKIEYSFSDEIHSIFELSSAGGAAAEPIEQLPLQLEAGEPLMFSYRWNIRQETDAASSVYKVYATLTFKTEDGRTVRNGFTVNHNLNLSEEQIKWLIRTGGEQP